MMDPSSPVSSLRERPGSSTVDMLQTPVGADGKPRAPGAGSSSPGDGDGDDDMVDNETGTESMSDDSAGRWCKLTVCV